MSLQTGGSGAAAGGRSSENEALIESSFRRLLASIEAEREKIRSTWLAIDNDAKGVSTEVEKLRQDTEEWCHAERHRVDNEWKRLDKLREKMSVLYPEQGTQLQINCSGRIFQVPKSALCCIEGSYLNHMFSEAFVDSVPTDPQGRYFLDFNPDCFAIIVDYLQAAHHGADLPAPTVPAQHRQNMDILAQALNLKAFLRPNEVMKDHGTSLRISGNTVESTFQGWQIVAARDPLPMSGSSYFEVKIVSNPDTARGGLAVGVCGHQPSGGEVFKIAMPDAVVYVSHNGLVANNCVAMENVQKVQLKEGTVIGVKHDMSTRSIQWYINRVSIGTCSLQTEALESMRVLYPIFALYVPGQVIQVDFTAMSPSATHGGSVSGDRQGST